MNKLSIASFGLVCSLTASSASANWSNNGVRITAVEVDSATQTYVTFSAVPTNFPACGGASIGLISLTVDAQKTLTSLVTNAFLAGKPVTVHWTGACSTVGGVTYPLFDMLTMT